MRDNRTGDQRRADHRAAIADKAKAAIDSDRCDRSALGQWAGRLDVSTQHLDDVLRARKALHADVLAEAPPPVLDDVVQHLIGQGRIVVELPEAIETADDLMLLAKMLREQHAVVESYMAAAADGVVVAPEGRTLADAARRSMAITAAVEQLGLRAAREGFVRLKVTR